MSSSPTMSLTPSCNKMIVFFNDKYPKGINMLMDNDPSIIEKYYTLLQKEDPKLELKNIETIREATTFFRYMWIKYLKDFYFLARKYEIIRNVKKSAIFDFSIERTFFDISVTESFIRLFKSNDYNVAYRCMNFYYGFFKFNDFISRLKENRDVDYEDDDDEEQDFEKIIKNDNYDQIIEKLDRQQKDKKIYDMDDLSSKSSDTSDTDDYAEPVDVSSEDSPDEISSKLSCQVEDDQKENPDEQKENNDSEGIFTDEEDSSNEVDDEIEEEIISDEEFKQMIARYE